MEDQVYKIKSNFTNLVEKMNENVNEITFLATSVPAADATYAIKLELRGQVNRFIKVSKFTVKPYGGFTMFSKDSCTSESYHPVLDNIPINSQNASTASLKAKLSGIANEQSPVLFYFKIQKGIIGIDTNDNKNSIQNPLSVPMCMANIDKLLAQPGILEGGSKKPVSSTKSLTKEKITYNGRKHSVYLGSRGGKYIKTKGEFMSVARLNL